MNEARLKERKEKLEKKLKPDFKIKDKRDWQEEKWKCPHCDYRFATKLDLKMHSYNHS